MKPVLRKTWLQWRDVVVAHRQRVVAGLLAAAAIYFSVDLMKPSVTYKVLMHDLETSQAVTVAASLDGLGIDYRVADKGAAIMVPSEVDEDLLYLRLAENGSLPDQIPAPDSWMEQAGLESPNTIRERMRMQLQHQLARTIQEYPQVVRATVYLSPGRNSPFVRDAVPAKASVMLVLRSPLSPRHLEGIASLIASSQDGLLPEAVTISDQNGALRGHMNPGLSEVHELLAHRQAHEQHLASKANNALSVIGPDSARVLVSLDLDRDKVVLKTREYDRENKVRTQEKSIERHTEARPNWGGLPGTDPNIYERIPLLNRLNGQTSSEERKETEWVYPMQTSISKIVPGAIRRISVAIVINETYSAQTEAITEVVKAAVGFQDGRDVFAAQTLPFKVDERVAFAITPNWWQRLVHPMVVLPAFGCFAVLGLMVHYMVRRRILEIHERELQAASRPGLELQRQLETAHPRLRAHPELVASAIQVWIESEQPIVAEREHERPKVLADE